MIGKLEELFGAQARPNETIREFISHIKKEGTAKNIKKGSVFVDFTRDSGFLHLIESGSIGFYRKQDRLLIQDASAPIVVGLAFMYHQSNLIVLAHSNLVVHKVRLEAALESIERNNLWRETTAIMAWIIRSYTSRDATLVGLDAYQVIKNHLIALSELPAEERLLLTAAKYITDRTFISRSRVMDILRQLNKGGYITIKNGILINITHLPENF